jgi:Lrp/AsnC family transcriptional regulator, leucine-responsive regulatory protein
MDRGLVADRPKIDAIDARLLERLQVDGRRAYADLGSDVGISGPSAHERVKKLEAKRVITGYAATVDPTTAGYPIVAFCWLTQAPGSAGADLTDAFEAIGEIEECHHIAGEADYLLKIRARDTRHLEDILVVLQATPHVFTTQTEVVLSSAFEHRPLRLVAASGETAEAQEP